jgi:hypothetical protein
MNNLVINYFLFCANWKLNSAGRFAKDDKTIWWKKNLLNISSSVFARKFKFQQFFPLQLGKKSTLKRWLDNQLAVVLTFFFWVAYFLDFAIFK